MLRRIYWLFAYLGAMTLTASYLMGFRHASDAPVQNVLFDFLLYAAFISVHIVMTTSAFKRVVFGRPEGTVFERRIYVTVSVTSWIVVYWLHWPVGGFGYASPPWLQYVGYCAMLLAIMAFFEFATFEGLGLLLATSSEGLSHSAGGEAPLMTAGPYARVRHPMYRAALLIAFTSLLVHPNAGQLLFAVLTTASFIGFIPFEEHQLIAARGDEYRDYMRETPYRLLPGVW